MIMIKLEVARAQLLSQIELELCSIYHEKSNAPVKLREFYDYVSELPLSNIIFAWYRINLGNVCIKCIGAEVRIYKSDVDEPDHNYDIGKSHFDALDELIDQSFENEN